MSDTLLQISARNYKAEHFPYQHEEAIRLSEQNEWDLFMALSDRGEILAFYWRGKKYVPGTVIESNTGEVQS